MWQLHVQLMGGPVLIRGHCPPPAYTGWEVVRALGGAQTAALGALGLLPPSGSRIPRLPTPGRHRRPRGRRPQRAGGVEALAPFQVGGCLLSSEPAPPVWNRRQCQVPVAAISTDLRDGRARSGGGPR